MAWCEGLRVSLPEWVIASSGLDRSIDAHGALHISAQVPVIERAAVDGLRLRAAFTTIRPLSAMLPVSYHLVPGPLRRAIAHGIGRWHRRRIDRWTTFPDWPLDLSADVLADLGTPYRAATGPVPVLLTHDIDSAEGLRNLVSLFLPMEEAVGARSTSYIVPRRWPLDEGLLRATHGRGHELGIHGFNHANRTPFAAPAERRERLHAPMRLAARYGMTGYRAPSLVRTRELLADIAELYRYDSSIPTSGGVFPVPNNGCATARPFRIGSLVEIPLSLPPDGSLRFFGFPPADILALWQASADRIARARGVVVLLTHCEAPFSGNAAMLHVYRTFLEWIVADGRFTWSRANDLAATVPDVSAEARSAKVDD